MVFENDYLNIYIPILSCILLEQAYRKDRYSSKTRLNL